MSIRETVRRDILRRVFEDYHSMLNIGNEPVTVFVNPTAKEIQEVTSSFGRNRWVADSKTNKVYVWTSEATHSQVMPTLGLDVDYHEKIPVSIVYGQGQPEGGKIRITQMDQPRELSDAGMSKVTDQDWSFISKYISNPEYIESNFKSGGGSRYRNPMDFPDKYPKRDPSEIPAHLNSTLNL